MGVNTKYESSVPLVKKVYIPPPSAVRVQLPDGRYLAYHDLGVPSDRARFSLIVPHGFVSSRFAGRSLSELGNYMLWSLFMVLCSCVTY